jgi:hypothetical protein
MPNIRLTRRNPGTFQLQIRLPKQNSPPPAGVRLRTISTGFLEQYGILASTPRFGLCIDLMSPSVHSWHQKESIGVLSAQLEEILESTE